MNTRIVQAATPGRRRAYGAEAFAALLLAVLAPAWGQDPGTLLQAVRLARYSPEQIDELARPLFEEYERPASFMPVDAYRISYLSTDFDGSSAVIQARLFVPVYESPAERPLLVFGSGTTGIADGCAPSLEQPEVRRWGHYRGNMLSYAGVGLITVFPDYLGFNDPSFYLNME